MDNEKILKHAEICHREQTGILFFGDKYKFAPCVEIYYTPTPEQIKNIKETFGWDVVLYERKEEKK